MKNNTKFAVFSSIIISLLFLSLFIISNYHFRQQYQTTNNLLLSSLINKIKTTYPELSEIEIIEVLNNPDLTEEDLFKKYGINIQNESLSIKQQNLNNQYFLFTIISILIYSLTIILIIIIYNKKEKAKINKITNYLKELNNHQYSLAIEDNQEEDLSLLKNEIYKTAITLNEQTLLLKKDKESLKDSLSDISHQLKTPLTSINLMIDTLRHQDNLSSTERRELLNNIHRKITNTNFLVHSLLKLSKFDANTIEFNRQNNTLSKILKEVLDNLSTLSDLKDIKINIKGSKDISLYCDYKWEVEALTNIIKNCIEHSNNSSKIDITYQKNDIFTKIIIQDNGCGISKKDLPHIFERFYKAQNSSKDSIGIGLSLAKTIIEKDNGYITVDSVINEGTTFTIKYLK